MHKDAFQVLAETSRTFFLPIQRLPDGLKDAVASAYLAMRAIDEIEDLRHASKSARSILLRRIAGILESATSGEAPLPLDQALERSGLELPEVTLRLREWLDLAPSNVRFRIFDSIGSMAQRMADWVECDFRVESAADLDRYTYAVAGAVGLLLADLWMWWNGTPTDRTLAVGFGRGLQAVNVLRNRDEDLANGVDFFPTGWSKAEVTGYARRNLDLADRYCDALPRGPIHEFCALPLALAHATLEAIEEGREKLSRSDVEAIVARLALR